MIKKVAIAFMLILCGLMGAVVYAFPYMIDKEAIKDEIAVAFKSLTGLDVEIEGETVIERFPTPRVVVNSMYVHNAQGGTAPFLLTVKLVEVWPSYRSLLTKHVTIRKIHIDDVDLELERLKNGQMNWKDSSVQTSAPQNFSKYLSDVSSAIAGSTVSITNAYLHYSDAISGSSLEYDDISLSFLNGGTMESTLGISLKFKDKPLSIVGKIGSIPYALSVGEVPANLVVNSGKSELNYHGTAGFKNDKFSINGNLKITTDDIIYWIGAMLGTNQDEAQSGDEPYKLLSFEGTSDIVTTPDDKITLPNLKLSGDIIKGSGEVELTQPYGIDIKSTINSLDLEALFASKLFASKIFEMKPGDLIKPEVVAPQETDFVMTHKSLFELMKLNAEVKIDDTMYNQQHLKDSHISLDMSNGEMTISQAVSTLPGDTRVVFAGIGKNGFQGFALEGEVDASGGNFSDAVKVLKSNGASFPEEDFKRFRLKANALISSKELRLSEITARIENMGFVGGFISTFGKRIKIQAAMRIGGVNFDHFVQLWGIPQWRTSLVDTTPDARYDSFLARWLRRLDYDTSINISLEQFILNAAERDKATLHLRTTSGKVYLDDIKTAYNGSNINGSFVLDVTGALPKIEMKADFDKFDTDTFFTSNGKPVAGATPAGTLAALSPSSGEAVPAGMPSTPVLTPPATADAAPGGAPPTPVLTVPTADSAPPTPPVLPPLNPGSASPVPSATGGSLSVPGAVSRWSHKPFDFHWLELINATFHFKFDDYKEGMIIAHNLDVLGGVDSQTLTLESITGTVQGAQIAAKTVIKGGAIPSIKVAANIVSLDPMQLLPFLPVLQGMTGRYNLSIRLDTTGVDLFSWMSSLEGSIGVGGENVDIHGFNLAGVIHSVSYVRTVADILSVVRRAFPGGDTMFTNIEGQWTVAGGVLKTANSRLANEQADGLLTCQVDLVNWLLQSSINLSLKTLDAVHPPGMIITFNGSLDRPETSLDTRSLEEYVTNKTSEKMLKEYGTQ